MDLESYFQHNIPLVVDGSQIVLWLFLIFYQVLMVIYQIMYHKWKLSVCLEIIERGGFFASFMKWIELLLIYARHTLGI